MKELTKEQKEELKRLADEIMNLATEVVDDYEKNPSEMSGSVTEVHIDSPILTYEEEYKLHDRGNNTHLDGIDEEPIEDQATKDRKRWAG